MFDLVSNWKIESSLDQTIKVHNCSRCAITCGDIDDDNIWHSRERVQGNWVRFRVLYVLGMENIAADGTMSSTWYTVTRLRKLSCGPNGRKYSSCEMCWKNWFNLVFEIIAKGRKGGTNKPLLLTQL